MKSVKLHMFGEHSQVVFSTVPPDRAKMRWNEGNGQGSNMVFGEPQISPPQPWNWNVKWLSLELGRERNENHFEYYPMLLAAVLWQFF